MFGLVRSEAICRRARRNGQVGFRDSEVAEIESIAITTKGAL
jgi:hypothetical protein